MLAKATRFLCDFQVEFWVNSIYHRSLQSSKKLIAASTDAKGPDVALEIINWRVVASGPRPEMNLQVATRYFRPKRCSEGISPRLFSRVWRIRRDCRVRSLRFQTGGGVYGPAIVEERESTLIVGPTVVALALTKILML